MISLHHGDCRDVLRTLPSDSLDSCCTDPPYALVSVVKRFGGPNAAPAKDYSGERPSATGAYMRASSGFMGKTWDTGETAFSTGFWAEVYRVLKPGAFVAAFGASRGYHRMACAIEDAGFEIRDSLMWVYGVGFPKSHNISGHETFCQCGAEQATERNVRCVSDDDVSPSEHTDAQRREILQSGVPQFSPQGVRTEPAQGIADVPQPGVEGRSDVPTSSGQLRSGEVRSLSAGIATDGTQGRLRDGAPVGHGAADRSHVDANGVCASSGSRAAAQRGNQSRTVAGQPLAQDGGAWPNCGRCGKPMVPEGLGTALKPAFEPIVLARKPLSEGTVAANVLRWRTGALNIDASRIAAPGVDLGRNNNARKQEDGTSYVVQKETMRIDNSGGLGRWPANVVHDGSDEVVGAFPTAGGQQGRAREGGDKKGSIYGDFGSNKTTNPEPRGDSGSAARFFYSAKASKADRAGSKHPTVKPISLMEWLATLITPPGGTVLDPFAGSGTTGAAAKRKGFNCILIEREDEYARDIRNRLGLADAADPLALAIERYLRQKRVLAGLAA